MQSESTDVFIAGGGIAGLTAAIAFAQAGFAVICADPAFPVTEQDSGKTDLRSTAFLQPAQALLEEIDLWPRLALHAAPLQIMRILDAGRPGAPIETDFNASDISEQPFGWNFPNWLLRREALAQLAKHPTAKLCFGNGVTHVTPRTGEAVITLKSGTKVTAKLLIAADGRNSTVRQALGIDAKTLRYGQKALSFSVSHPVPHQNISTEIHQTGGPFTLVPLPDHGGLPASAVVWMDRAPEAMRRAALEEHAFTHELNARSCGILGPLTPLTPRSVWPIIAQHAQKLTAPRTALIAEAAHVVPPIGAQGLNMSLADLRCLLDLAREHRAELGNPQMLAAYEKARLPDIRTRIAGIDLLNRASMAEAKPLRDLRATGLKALHGIAPVRRALMQLGLGSR